MGIYVYKSLYVLKQGKGLISENHAYMVYDTINKAWDKQKEIQEFIPTEVVDMYDYFKEYRGETSKPEEFYLKVSKLIHDGDQSIQVNK